MGLRLIPDAHREIIRQFYTASHSPLREKLDSRAFVKAIEKRIHSEWNNDPNPSWQDLEDGTGAYNKFFNDEKMFAATRMAEAGTTPNIYFETIEGVLKALTLRAIDYFEKYGKEGDTSEQGENLRTSLEPWFNRG